MFAIVDDEDYARVSGFNWSACKCNNNFYAIAVIDGKKVLLHRFILNAPSDRLVDHKDGKTLDNRKLNIRIATYTENNRNRRANKKSLFKGVSKCSTGFKARIRFNDQQIYLGFFKDPEQAARVYDAAAIELHGEFARLNFPA